MTDTDDLDPEMAAAIAAAEAAVAGLADSYAPELARDGAALADVAAAMKTGTPGTDSYSAACEEAFRIAHDIKGQAGSFGFEGAGLLCGLLCDALRHTRTPRPDLAVAIDNAAGLIVRIADDGPHGKLDAEAKTQARKLEQAGGL